jgi:cytochrome c2
MEFQGLSDEDIAAVISYLRSRPPVRNPVPAHEYTLLGRVLRATMFSKPIGPGGTSLAKNPQGANVENGRYLVESVALCWACHTQRDDATGQLVGPRHGGTTGFIEPGQPGITWSPPNITSDPETGKLGRVTEDEFVTRFRAGRVLPNSPMPWQGLQKLAEDDLRAIYRYLKSLPPVKNDVGPPFVAVTRK